MMHEEQFRKYLKRCGRAPHVLEEVVRIIKQYADFLATQRNGVQLTDARPEDLEAFVTAVESQPRQSAKNHLLAIAYYYTFIGNEGMRSIASSLRETRITRTSFSLGDFRGVDPSHIQALARHNIRNVSQMLAAGQTPGQRSQISKQTGIPEEAILELVRLSDLARIPGVKGIRARLYMDAGIDSLDRLAALEAEELCRRVVDFVEQTGFNGIPTLPAEARFTVEMAKKLPRVVEY